MVRPSRRARPRPLSGSEWSTGVESGDDVDWTTSPSADTEVTDQWKQPVRVATTANVTISTALNAGDTLDGVTLAAFDRVLVKDQSTGSQNGIYIAGTTPERAVDFDDDDEVLGAIVYVIAGTTNAATAWKVTNTAAVTVGSTSIVFAAFGAGGGTFATPAIVLGTAAAAGAASTVIRSDSTIAAFDATSPTTQALGDSAVVGTAAFAARRDHKHAMPTAAVTTSGLTQATGKLLGRSTASTGAIEEITVGSGLTLSAGSLTASGGASSLTVEEVDGSPTDSAVTTLVFPNGTLGIASHVATYTPSGGGGPSDYVSGPSGTGHITIPGVAVPDRAPASPSGSDDEFDTTDTSDPMTGWSTLGSFTSLNMNSDAASHLHMANASIGYAVNGVYKAAPSMPFTVTAKISDWLATSNYVQVGIMLLDSTPTALYTVGPVFGGYVGLPTDYVAGKWTNRTSRASAADTNLGVPLYCHYQRLIVTSSTSVTSQFSFNGYTWLTVYSAVTSGLTVSKVGLFVAGNTAGGATDAFFDWIRFT